MIFVMYVENLDQDESEKILTLNHLFNHSHEEESFLLMLHLNEDDVTLFCRVGLPFICYYRFD